MAAKTKKPPLTHFLCIPLVTASSAPQWQASLDRFILDATATSATSSNSDATTTSASEPDTNMPTNEDQSRRSLELVGRHSDSEQHTTPGVAVVDAPLPEAQNAVQIPFVPAPRSAAANTSARHTHPGPALPAKAVRPLHSLHLTLGVMSLREPARVEEAKSLLREWDVAGMLRGETGARNDSAAGDNKPQPLRLTMRSLLPMQSARSTSVLYTEPYEPSGRLLPLCQALRQTFAKRGMILDEGRDLKLHATIVNTLHAKPKSKKKGKKLPAGWGRAEKKEGSGTRDAAAVAVAETVDPVDEERAAEEGAATDEDVKRKGISSKGKIDGRWLIQKWKEHVWAEVELEKVAICEMGAKADENGVVRYREVEEASLKL